jgi:sugar phosphate permease
VVDSRTPATIGFRRWTILAVGITAQATTCSFLYGLAFLIPELQASTGIALANAGTLVSAPILGLLLGLIGWGAAADKYGERIVIMSGMTATGVVLLGSLALPGLGALGAGLVVAGGCAASVNAASGRVVLGWFTPEQRGLAMGIRQTAQPIGVGIAAACLPALGQHWGFRVALALPAMLCLGAAALVAAFIIDPPRPNRNDVEETRSPYRFGEIWRLHAASALLVTPQFVAGAFAMTYLVSRRGFDPVSAGALLAVVQVIGAAGRIAAGVWSDRVGSRTRPMRTIALLAMATMVLWLCGDLLDSWLAVVAVAVALVITVAPNGLAFTAAAELAGPFWAGRALGIQNTTQNAVALATVPLFSLIITSTNYVVALAIAAVPALIAALVTPVRR